MSANRKTLFSIKQLELFTRRGDTNLEHHDGAMMSTKYVIVIRLHIG